ncbi:MAG: hypothetical protein Q9195_005488 [Heterodermia aff. obscurata]
MWLDRFSGHSTPSQSPPPPQNRALSPAPPRRPSQLGPGLPQRPAYGPRTSSLNLASRSNISTTSVNSQKLPNGSTLKHEVTPPADFPDPLEVLEKVLGRTLQQDHNADGVSDGYPIPQKPSELVKDVDFGGLSLEDFAQSMDLVESKQMEVDTRMTAQTVEEYEREKDKFEDLHRSILACDNVLKSVELSLTSFQKDLGTVSAEIETLQSRSTTLNTRLENRRVVEKLLGPAVEEVSIAPAVVKTIAEGPIDQEWVMALEDLEKRSKVIGDKVKGSEKVRAVTDIKPLLDDLTNKAIERIRDFLVSQIKALRSSNMNAQIIQRQSFLKYRDLYAFLARHHSQLAEEIGQAYINTMRWYYSSNFTRYRQALEKMPLFTVDKQDALGNDPSATSKPVQPAHDPLSLGRRIDVLKRSNPNALTSYLASEAKSATYLETPFFNFALALIDNATAEYTFLTTFFSPLQSYHEISRSFSSIFSPTFALGTAYTKTLIEPTYDCLGLLLCVRLNQHLAFELQRRKIPVADGYINATNMLLWPRFQLAMDAHHDSIRRATASLSSTTRALTSLGSSSASAQSTAPTPLTQRFGQLLQGILALSAEQGTEASEPVGSSVGRLIGEMEAYLAKAGRGLQAGRRERFLSSNWSLVRTIVGDGGGKLGEGVRERVEGLRG